MFKLDWLILRVAHQSFEIELSKGHYSEVFHMKYQTLFGEK